VFGHAFAATRVGFMLIQVSALSLLNYYYIRKRFSLNDDACQVGFS